MKISKVPKIILWPCLTVALLVLYISIEAVLETQNWSWFDIDFTNKDKVIAGYGALLAAIISTFSIILLVYTIYLQLKESREQARRFRKEHKLQKKQFRAEKKREERKEKLDLYYKLKLISVFLESIIVHIEKTAIEIERFYQAEKENPIGMNMLYFLVNKSMSKLIEMDYLAIFIAFKEFFKDEESWTKNFNNLFDLVGFYKDALEELRDNYKNHTKDKFLRKSKISEELKSILSLGAEIIDRYKEKYNTAYLEQPFSFLINEFIGKYYEIIELDNIKNRETNLDELSQGLLLEFLQESMGIRDKFGFDNLGSLELTSSISSIRKDIYKLKLDCIYFAENVETRYNDYFSPDSNQLRKIKELKNYIDEELDKINPDKL